MKTYEHFKGKTVNAYELLDFIRSQDPSFALEPPVDVKAILEFLNIDYSKKPDFRKPKTVGSISTKQNKPVIWVNPMENRFKARERFTIAHELGHFFTHITTNDLFINSSDIDPIEDESIQLNRDQSWNYMEFEANTFAAQLLMPKDLIYKELKTIYANEPSNLNKTTLISNLADKFNVSESAMEYRLFNLEIIK